MDISREVVLQSQGEVEKVRNVEEVSADLEFTEGNPPREESTAISISVISNSLLLTEGLLALLAPHLKLQLMGTYDGEFRITTPLPNPQGHVVLLDSSVGHTVAIAWTRYWRGLVPPAFVLILGLANDSTLILNCIEAGANGYTVQGASAVEIAEAISDVRCSKARCSPEITAHLYARLASLTAKVTHLSVSPLTARESEILRHIATGYTNLEIADHLVIEMRTVKQHVHHILGKLNVPSRGEAVRFAAEQGWLSQDLATSSNQE